MNDEIAELADRLRAKLRRGEEPGLEFEIEFASLTDDEPDEFLALFDQRALTRRGKGTEDSPENVRILRALLDLLGPAARRPARRWGRLSRPATSACWRSSRRPARCLTRWLTRCVRPRPTGRTARGEESAPRCSCSGRPLLAGAEIEDEQIAGYLDEGSLDRRPFIRTLDPQRDGPREPILHVGGELVPKPLRRVRVGAFVGDALL